MTSPFDSMQMLPALLYNLKAKMTDLAIASNTLVGSLSSSFTRMADSLDRTNSTLERFVTVLSNTSEGSTALREVQGRMSELDRQTGTLTEHVGMWQQTIAAAAQSSFGIVAASADKAGGKLKEFGQGQYLSKAGQEALAYSQTLETSSDKATGKVVRNGIFIFNAFSTFPTVISSVRESFDQLNSVFSLNTTFTQKLAAGFDFLASTSATLQRLLVIFPNIFGKYAVAIQGLLVQFTGVNSMMQAFNGAMTYQGAKAAYATLQNYGFSKSFSAIATTVLFVSSEIRLFGKMVVNTFGIVVSVIRGAYNVIAASTSFVISLFQKTGAKMDEMANKNPYRAATNGAMGLGVAFAGVSAVDTLTGGKITQGIFWLKDKIFGALLDKVGDFAKPYVEQLIRIGSIAKTMLMTAFTGGYLSKMLGNALQVGFRVGSVYFIEGMQIGLDFINNALSILFRPEIFEGISDGLEGAGTLFLGVMLNAFSEPLKFLSDGLAWVGDSFAAILLKGLVPFADGINSILSSLPESLGGNLRIDTSELQKQSTVKSFEDFRKDRQENPFEELGKNATEYGAKLLNDMSFDGLKQGAKDLSKEFKESMRKFKAIEPLKGEDTRWWESIKKLWASAAVTVDKDKGLGENEDAQKDGETTVVDELTKIGGGGNVESVGVGYARNMVDQQKRSNELLQQTVDLLQRPIVSNYGWNEFAT